MKASELKASILQLAVSGKLVAQNPTDEPASVLLKRIKKEREQLIKEGKIKKGKPLAEISEDEVPFEIPASWEWVRFGEIVVNRDGERIPLSLGERNHLEKIYDYYGASGIIDHIDRYIFDKRLLLIGEDGANLLMRSKPIAFFAEGKYWVNNHAHVIDVGEYVNIDYIAHYINAIPLNKYITGMAQPKLNQANLNKIPVPLPPLAEQHRIVARIEELMPLIEAYGREEQKLSALEAEFPDALRQSILQYAVEGKLVSQKAEDGTAAELLAKIRKERDALVKEGKIKKSKPLSPVSDEEKPFEIPASWEWVRLGDICMSIVDCPHSTPTWVEMGKICLRTTNVKPRKLDLSIVNYVSEASYLERILRMRPIENDIVYSREGTSVFSACLIPKDVAVCLGQRLMLLRVYDSLSSSYIMHYLNSPEILKYANVEQQGIAAKHINVKQVKNYAIPLPPLAEQRRIVERIEELMELCDRIPKKVK